MSLWVVVAGIAAAAGVAARAGVRAGVPVLLDFLLAAGLLRLSSRLAWDDIATVALIIGIRHVLSFGIRTRPAARSR